MTALPAARDDSALHSLQRHLRRHALRPADGALARLIASPAVLHAALRRVRRGGPSPGADGIAPSDLGLDDAAWLLDPLRDELLGGHYRPLPLRTHSIPRKGGKTPRLIAIPAVRDRIAQAATHLVLAPQLDATFDDASHGFRTGRGVRTAAAALQRAIDSGKHLVIRTDIRDCFGSLPHSLILEAVACECQDQLVLHWLRSWLEADLLLGTHVARLDRGIPQGLVIAPLLANACLHLVDRQWAAHDDTVLVRYADDIAIACRSQPDVWLQRLVEQLGHLQLELSEAKTEVADASTGFDFLGFRFQLPRGPGAARCQRGPSPEAVERTLQRLADVGKGGRWASPADAIAQVNAILRPWRDLHGQHHWPHQAEAVEHAARATLADWCRGHGHPVSLADWRRLGLLDVRSLPA